MIIFCEEERALHEFPYGNFEGRNASAKRAAACPQAGFREITRACEAG